MGFRIIITPLQISWGMGTRKSNRQCSIKLQILRWYGNSLVITMIATRRTLCPIIMRLEFVCWKQDHHCNNLGLLSLTPVNFDSNMDKWLHQLSSVGWDYLSIPNLQRCAFEVWELISKFIPHFITNVMIYQCWTLKLTHISQRGPWWLFSMCTATLWLFVTNVSILRIPGAQAHWRDAFGFRN